ncbi:unannotated protein [freshwater metagenome]|uniref:Unannotated protein n=1 Tax=freshwater metagenome TaxID=449393 RepID=A0A6J6U0N4_9ZZZZ
MISIANGVKTSARSSSRGLAAWTPHSIMTRCESGATASFVRPAVGPDGCSSAMLGTPGDMHTEPMSVRSPKSSGSSSATAAAVPPPWDHPLQATTVPAPAGSDRAACTMFTASRALLRLTM